MIPVRRSLSRLTPLVLIVLLGLVAACGNSGDAADDVSGAMIDNVESPDSATDAADAGNGQASENAPDPIPVDVDELDIIDEWRQAGVPRFRHGEVLDFEPHASSIENGGTLLLDGVNADAGEIIGFYRGALGALNWRERNVTDTVMTVESDIASLLIVVTEYEDQTLIMMILTDNVVTD